MSPSSIFVLSVQENLATADSAGNPVAWNWDRFIAWREGADLFSLYKSPRLFMILPKRFINAADIPRLAGLLEARLGARR